jgi:hypothetical protein
MRQVLVLLIVSGFAVVVLAAGSAPAERADACTWGASSVMVEDVNGRLVQSEPVVTGCVPP